MNLVYVGSDHRGFNLKKSILEFLRGLNYEVYDMGASEYNPDDDYSEIAIKLAEKVAIEKTKGILICASGVGVCVAANKVDGIRAALCTSEKQARLAREDDGTNILCLSSELVDEETNFKIVKMFLETVFSSEEKHIRRINIIKNYEKAKLG
jgi:ribose 5-phosphate isomerase B